MASLITVHDVPAFIPVTPYRPPLVHFDFSSQAGLASFVHNR